MGAQGDSVFRRVRDWKERAGSLGGGKENQQDLVGARAGSPGEEGAGDKAATLAAPGKLSSGG